MAQAHPHYDPAHPRKHYDEFAEREWLRLTRNRLGDLLFHNHMDVLRTHVQPSDRVLELGAGAGIFTKELVHLCRSLVVSDISPKQVEINRQKMAELGVLDRVERHLELDITDLSPLGADAFDVVTCVGGAINYTFDNSRRAAEEMLRVTKPGGLLILGSMSLVSTIVRAMSAVIAEKERFGIDATRFLLETGQQDGVRYPVDHRVHMLTSADMDALVSGLPVTIVEKRAAGLLALAGEPALDQAKRDVELWPLLLEMEIAWSKLPGALDGGANLLYVLRK